MQTGDLEDHPPTVSIQSPITRKREILCSPMHASRVISYSHCQDLVSTRFTFLALSYTFSVPLIWVRPASTFCNTLSRALNRFPSSSSSFFSLLFHDKLRRVFFLATHIDILKAVERVLTYLLSSSDELKTIALFKNLNYEDLTLHYVLSWPLF